MFFPLAHRLRAIPLISIQSALPQRINGLFQSLGFGINRFQVDRRIQQTRFYKETEFHSNQTFH